MNRLYEKSRLAFALAWIGAYVLLFSLADKASAALGVEKCITAPLCILMCLVLRRWLCKNGLAARYGLCAVRGRAKDYWYYVPLMLLWLVNLRSGIALRMSAAETALYIASMLGVGFLEEDGTRHAMLISAATFGLGHIVNLLNGAPLAATLAQIVYAFAAGLLFVVLYVRSGSLLPCIITHGVLNSLSAFSPVEGGWAGPVVLTMVSLLYAWRIWKHKKGILE